MSKTPKYAALITDFINARIGQIISPVEIMDAVHCTAPTVYSFIKDNNSRFEKVSAGKYRVLSVGSSNQIFTIESD